MYKGGLPIPATWADNPIDRVGGGDNAGLSSACTDTSSAKNGGGQNFQGIKRSLMECLDEDDNDDDAIDLNSMKEKISKNSDKTVHKNSGKIIGEKATKRKKNTASSSSSTSLKQKSVDRPVHNNNPVVEKDDVMYNHPPQSLYDSTNPKLSMTPSIRKQQESDMCMRTVGVTLNAISEAIRSSKTFENKSKLRDLNLDTVLSSTSYANLMRQTFGNEGSILPRGGEDSGRTGEEQDSELSSLPKVSIPTITRAFEESYMREPMSNERECARGSKCECQYIDPTQPFTCVEFLTINEIANPPKDNQLCIICSRKETQYLYYDMTFNKKVYNSVIQRYGNISGGGEYAAECLLRCTKQCDLACMPKPIMSHQRNRYTVYKNHENGIISLRQTRVSPRDYVSSANLENPTGILNTTVCASLGTTEMNATGHVRPGKSRGF